MHLETDRAFLADDESPFDWAECGALVELADLTWRPRLVTCQACIQARDLDLAEARLALALYLRLMHLSLPAQWARQQE